MKSRIGWKNVWAVLLLCATTPIAAPAQTFTTLLNFDGSNGANPLDMSLAQGANGELFGTTSTAGTHEEGTVFKIAAAAKLTTLYSFCDQSNCADGAFPQAGLVLGADGNFYGTTSFGGANDAYGTIYKITPLGILTTLHSFDGADGWGDVRMVQGVDGNLYGTTMTGGTSGYGSIFKITPHGQFTTLYSFCQQSSCADGSYPRSGLLQAADGNFYGTTVSGGYYYYYGTVFKVTRDGTVTTLHSFDFHDGDYPIGVLVQGTDGNLYGTTADGGFSAGCPSGCGTIFSMTPSGTLTTTHSFGSTDGAQPFSGLVLGADGNFYGTTSSGGDLTCNAPYGAGCGTVFEISPNGAMTTLHNFDFTDGYAPNGLLQRTDGKFYGTTYGGGDNEDCTPNGCGTAFRVDAGLGPFVAFVHNSGKVGQTGGILGQGFAGTTSVSFNGTPASFMLVSDTFIKATVPPGTTTGYVAVTTPSGVLTSNVPFQVIHNSQSAQ